MQAEAIPVGALTHLNRDFIQFDGKYKLIDAGGGLVAHVSKLKLRYPSLRITPGPEEQSSVRPLTKSTASTTYADAVEAPGAAKGWPRLGNFVCIYFQGMARNNSRGAL